MPELSQEQREILDLFRYGAEHLEKTVAGLTDEQLDYHPAPGEWSIRQIVHHVADDGDAWAMNIKKALANPGARVRFEDFPGNDAWSAALSYDTLPIETAVTLVKAHRAVLAELAGAFPDRWEQAVAIVDSDGKKVAEATVKDMLKGNEGHLHDHILVIEEISKKHGL